MPDAAEPTRTPQTSMATIGYGLVALSILAVVALLHHPVGHGREPEEILSSMRSQTATDQLVHGALAVVFGLLTTAMILFASRLGARRATVISGLVAYGCAFVLLVLAAMTDGFVVPEIVAKCVPDAASACVPEALTLLRMSALEIEFLTRFALVASAIAVVLWSAALLTTRGVPRLAGLVGLACGGCQFAALLLVQSHLRADSLLLVFGAQIAWYLLVAWMMIRRQGRFAEAAGA